MMRSLVVCMVLASSPALAQIGTWQGDSASATAGARASLAPDGPWLTGTLAQGEELEIHNKRGARPQFLERASGASLLMYVDAAGLATCTREGAVLYPTPASALKERDAKSIGMYLGAGRVLDSIGPDESGLSAVKISWHWGGGNALELRGYIATERLVKVYAHMPEDIPAFEPDVTLPGDYKLLDAPNGKPFATSTNRDRLPAVVLEKRGGFTLVRVAQGAIGWIAAAQVKPAAAITPKKRKVKDIVQPVHISKDDPEGDENGVEGGEVGGVVGGVGGDTMLPEHTPIYDRPDGRVVGEVSDGYMLPVPRADKAWLRYELDTRFGKVSVWAKKSALVASAPPPPPPPPPPPAPPQAVPPTALEPLRLTGNNHIWPDEVTKTEIERSSKDKVVASFKLCIDTSGQVTVVSQLKSSGFPSYDSKLAAGMRAWTFKPFLVSGKPTPVCTAETFIYSKR
jgi:hypothetical protein